MDSVLHARVELPPKYYKSWWNVKFCIMHFHCPLQVVTDMHAFTFLLLINLVFVLAFCFLFFLLVFSHLPLIPSSFFWWSISTVVCSSNIELYSIEGLSELHTECMLPFILTSWRSLPISWHEQRLECLRSFVIYLFWVDRVSRIGSLTVVVCLLPHSDSTHKSQTLHWLYAKKIDKETFRQACIPCS